MSDKEGVIHLGDKSGNTRGSKGRRICLSLLMCAILAGALAGAAYGGAVLYKKEQDKKKEAKLKKEKESEKKKDGDYSKKDGDYGADEGSKSKETEKGKDIKEDKTSARTETSKDSSPLSDKGQEVEDEVKPVLPLKFQAVDTMTGNDFDKDTDTASTVDVEKLQQFIDTAAKVTQKYGKILGVELNLPPVSANTLLVYFREMELDDVLEAAASAESLDDLPLEKLVPIVKKLKSAFSEEGLKEWGKKLSTNHKRKGATTSMSMDTLDTMVKQQEGSRRLLKEISSDDEFEELSVPIVIHVLQYSDGGKVRPGGHSKDAAKRWIERVNYLFNNTEFHKHWSKTGAQKPAKVQFYLKELRDEHSRHSYLLMRDMKIWAGCEADEELMMSLAKEHNVKPTTHINVYVCGYKVGGLGYAYVPSDGSDGFGEDWQASHIFMRYETYNTDEYNNAEAFDYGGSILAHELGHHLGLGHPFDQQCDGDGDQAKDTRSCIMATEAEYFASLTQICDVWRLKGEWSSGEKFVASKDVGGYALKDMKTCPKAKSSHIDPVNNVMNYVPPSCFSYFTPDQIDYMQKAIKALRPKLYKACKSKHSGERNSAEDGEEPTEETGP